MRTQRIASALALSWIGAAHAAGASEPPTAPSEPAPPQAAAEPTAFSPGFRRGTGAPIHWAPGWRRFGWVNGVVIGVGAGAAGLALIVGPDRDAPRRGRNRLDEGIRDAVRPRSRGVRVAARRASDLLLAANLSVAYLGDVLFNAAWYRDSPDVAWQLALIDAQVLALATGVQLWTANLVSRERPYGRVCGTRELSASSHDCTGDYRFRSFYSGHTSFSFALAAATCTHHAHLPLYQGKAAWVPCTAALTVAGATGVARMAADQHYATDVLVGAALGGAIGWFVPWLHYSAGSGPRSSGGAAQISWTLVPSPNGLAVTGVF